ncbi:MAG: TolC family protein, partial [Gemmatimonadota bacterium]|nr:TolC family protein [Gemmatimonadota bacterium]
DVDTAVLQVETAFRTAQILERAAGTAAEELRLAEARFRAGEAASLEVVTAQTRLSEAERAQIDAVYNFHQSLALLESLVGRPLR